MTPRTASVTAAALTVASVVQQWSIDGDRRIDFRIYHRAVSSIGGAGLYGYGTGLLRFVYPPIAAVVFAPLAMVPESRATHLWLVLSVAMFVAGYAVVFDQRDLLGRWGRPIVLLAAAAAVWMLPSTGSLRLGQINPLVTLLLCVDLSLIRRNHRLGGVGTGVAAAIKLTPLGVVVLLLASARRRDGARGLVAFLALTGAAAIVDPASSWRYVTMLASSTDRGDTLGFNIRSCAAALLGAGPTADVVWLAASAALVVVATLRFRTLVATPRNDVAGAFAIATCLTYAISPVTWAHHLTFTVVAVALWATRAARVWQYVVAGVVVALLIDPLSIGGTSIAVATALVTFCVLTVVALPSARPSIP